MNEIGITSSNWEDPGGADQHQRLLLSETLPGAPAGGSLGDYAFMRLQLHAKERSSCAVLMQMPHCWTLLSGAGPCRGRSTHTLKTDMLLAQEAAPCKDESCKEGQLELLIANSGTLPALLPQFVG